MPEPHLFSPYRLVIFDADDTLRRTTVPGQPCPRRSEEWELMPGVRELLSQVPWKRSNAPHLGLASNQDQVAYGHLSLRVARELLRDLAFAATGLVPEDAALQLCPHALHIDCACRKPKPGMLLRLIEHFQVSREQTVFVGNSEVDRAAAAAAGVAFLSSDSVFGIGNGATQQ